MIVREEGEELLAVMVPWVKTFFVLIPFIVSHHSLAFTQYSVVNHVKINIHTTSTRHQLQAHNNRKWEPTFREKTNTTSTKNHDLKPKMKVRNSLPWTSTIVIALVVTMQLLPAQAVDNPVDYIHLNIPIPIPDADPRYFISGGLCAAASHGITTPIDVVKTKMQADPDKYTDGVFEAATYIWKTEGITTLLRGLGPTVVGYGIEGATKFGLYETLKPEMIKILRF